MWAHYAIQKGPPLTRYNRPGEAWTNVNQPTAYIQKKKKNGIAQP